MLVKGDKIKLVNKMGMFDNIGEICEVIDVSDSGVISFKFGNGMHMGCMSTDEFEKYFVKYEEPKKITISVDSDYVESMMERSNIIVNKVFDKCTIVACKLPNGFVIVESSSCVNPADYDEDMGVEICLGRILEKVHEMEAYKLQNEMWEDEMDEDDECDCCGCDGCDCEGYTCEDEDDDDDYCSTVVCEGHNCATSCPCERLRAGLCGLC